MNENEFNFSIDEIIDSYHKEQKEGAPLKPESLDMDFQNVAEDAMKTPHPDYSTPQMFVPVQDEPHEQEDYEYDEDDYVPRRTRKHRALWVGLGFVAVALGIVAGGMSYVYASETIFSGIYAGDIALGGMTQEQATIALAAVQDTMLAEASVPLVVYDTTYEISASELGATIDVARTVESAYAIGHEGSFITRAIEVLQVQFGGTSFAMELNYDESALEAVLQEIADEAMTLPTEGTWELQIEGTSASLLVTMPQAGVDYDREEVQEQVALRFANFDFTPYMPEVTVQEVEQLDFTAIKATVDSEKVNASYDVNTFEILESSPYLELDLSIVEQVIGDGTAESYKIPMVYEQADISAEQLESLLFRDILAETSTYLSESNTARTSNVRLAAESINGTILLPGEEFSYNTVVGQRTIENGYAEAGAYSNGEVITEVGGGVCQPSSTLYMAVLRADLEVTERSNHSLTVSYTPLGEDASVSWGSKDFRFINSTDYPLQINAWQTDGRMWIELVGTNIDGKSVTIETNVLATYSYDTVETIDPELTAGQTVEEQSGMTGYKTETYKVITVNGTTTTVKANTSTYMSRDRLVSVGAELEEPTVDAGATTPDTTTDTTVDGTTDTSTDTTTDSGTVEIPSAEQTDATEVPDWLNNFM